jgi:hypothetical protein
VKFALRNLVVWAVCAGVLVPVVSVTDDFVLLSAAVQELTAAQPLELRSHFECKPQDSSVAFWVQFEHMDFPVLLATVPEIGRADAISCPEPLLVSFRKTQTAVRGPPQNFPV